MSEGEGGVDVREMLELQLAEVEMLQSMFANPGEFTLDNKSVVDELRAVVDGTINYDCLDNRVGFTIKIVTSSTPACQLELICHFPHEYPSVHPEVFMRAPTLDRESHRLFSEELYKFLASLETGYILIGSVVEWLQENAHLYLKKTALTEQSCSLQTSKKEDMSFTRLWIYSHHIYSKFKRQDIVDWANELGLKGFSMPGKPVTKTKIMKILTDVPNLRITQRAGEGLNDSIMLANVLLVVRELNSPTRYPETKRCNLRGGLHRRR